MARQKSEQKKADLLTAACVVLVRDGSEASTASIAKEASVATGTLFTYFPTKAALYNELYLSLKQEMVAATTKSFTDDLDDRDKLRSLWTAWMNWAMTHETRQRALDILRTNELLTEQTLAEGLGMMQPVFNLIEKNRTKTADALSHTFLLSAIGALADTTTNLMLSEPDNAQAHCEDGFVAVWKLIS